LRRRADRRITQAKFPRLKRLSEFNVDAVRTIPAAQLGRPRRSLPRRVCQCSATAAPEEHLLIGVGVGGLRPGRRNVRYVTTAQLVNELVEAADEHVLSRPHPVRMQVPEVVHRCPRPWPRAPTAGAWPAQAENPGPVGVDSSPLSPGSTRSWAGPVSRRRSRRGTRFGAIIARSGTARIDRPTRRR
jgi:hypothetical protein